MLHVRSDRRDPAQRYEAHPLTPNKHLACSKRSWDGSDNASNAEQAPWRGTDAAASCASAAIGNGAPWIAVSSHGSSSLTRPCLALCPLLCVCCCRHCSQIRKWRRLLHVYDAGGELAPDSQQQAAAVPVEPIARGHAAVAAPDVCMQLSAPAPIQPVAAAPARLTGEMRSHPSQPAA